jgi:hypothetical protein
VCSYPAKAEFQKASQLQEQMSLLLLLHLLNCISQSKFQGQAPNQWGRNAFTIRPWQGAGEFLHSKQKNK